MSNLLFLRRSYEYRHAAVAAFRKARAMPLGSERNGARVLARGLRDLARAEAWLKGKRLMFVVPALRSPTFHPVSPVSEPEMSDRHSCTTEEQVFNADGFVRCAVCWRWFDRGNPLSMAQHRGPLPHPVANPRTAWADEDE
jgi:hypothetical protein